MHWHVVLNFFFIFKANRTTHKNRKILMSYAIRNCSWKIISECLKPICLIVRSNMSVLLRILYILTNIKLFWRKYIFLTYCNNYVHLRKKKFTNIFKDSKSKSILHYHKHESTRIITIKIVWGVLSDYQTKNQLYISI